MKKAPAEAIEISRHICTFLDSYAPTQRTASSNTLKSYRYALLLYVEFLESEEGSTPECMNRRCLERGEIERWLAWLKDKRGCSPQTCNNRLGSFRTFLNYLGSRKPEYLYLYQEASGIPLMRMQKKKVKGLTRESVKALMDCTDPQRQMGRRDLVLMIVLYGTAARIDEILSLKNRQLHLDGERPYASIIGKGNKIRTLYLLPKAVTHIRKYLEEFHRGTAEPDAYLFYSRNTGPHGKLTQPAVAKMLKKYAKTAHEVCADVPLDLHAHQYRHAKASHWLEDGMNVVQISFLLGHENLSTTMRYLDITLEDEAKALSTLEDECDQEVTPKWKNSDGSLKSFCGLIR